MARLASPLYTLHAEGGPTPSTRITAPSAFRALGAYRTLRRAHWRIVLITDPKGRVTDEAALLRSVTIRGEAPSLAAPVDTLPRPCCAPEA